MVCELDALLAQAIHVGGGQALVAKTSHVSESHVVHHDVEHIGTLVVIREGFHCKVVYIVQE